MLGNSLDKSCSLTVKSYIHIPQAKGLKWGQGKGGNKELITSSNQRSEVIENIVGFMIVYI